jgi:catechol 2,3-dioxygenase-like lactoylglutathione lyase family enzyme
MVMLNQRNAAATIAVKDLNAARRFYEDTLGLTPVAAEEDEVIVFKSGDSVLNVYRSQYAGTNQATAVTWIVGDELEDIVEQLKTKGIRFEHYDLPNTTLRGDIHVAGHMKVAWFKDPDGNILNLASG